MIQMTQIVKSIYVKIIFGGVIVFIGIFGGIYVGNAMINKQPESPITILSKNNQQENELDAQFVNFNPGDLFPLESYTDNQNQVGNFEDLLQNKSTILLFVSLTCGPCHDLLKFWKHRIKDKVKKNVQVIVCIRNEDGKIPDEFAGLLDGMQVIRFDGSYWKETYDMSFWPTVVSVDYSGFVEHIQFGFENYLDYQIANKYLNK